MDAAPKALRPYILITTALVVLGAGAISLLWLMVFPSASEGITLPAGPSEADVHPVDFPDSVPADERARLRALGGRLLDPAEAARRSETASALGGAGRAALPVLLTALASDYGDESALRLHFEILESVLVAIRARLTPREPALPRADRAAAPPSVAEMRRRARLWFGWFHRLERTR